MIGIYRNDLIYSVSYALDYLEKEVVMISENHAKRVAYLAVNIGKTFGLDQKALLNLGACAALHDNALSEYYQKRLINHQMITPNNFGANLGLHCEMGEKNMTYLSFYDDIKGSILYHHENADGSGPFHKKADETPLYARIIHLADTLDALYDLSTMDEHKYLKISDFVESRKQILYDEKVVDAFLSTFDSEDKLVLHDRCLKEHFDEVLSEECYYYQPQQLINLSKMFAKIIDYKSPFTSSHSAGVAEKALQMAIYYGYNEDKQAQLYFAGALHDIGKLMVENDILEKPGKLDPQEYDLIKDHARAGYEVLHRIRGMETISAWAYKHHEKLDGSGYPFGLKGEALNHEERLMAVIDIYQALSETRPYKEPLTHEAVMKIMDQMVKSGKIDGQIVQDIDRCLNTI